MGAGKLGVSICVAAVAMLAMAASANADTVQVTDPGDSGSTTCTLRNAVDAMANDLPLHNCNLVVASGDDRITFATGITSITLSAGELFLSDLNSRPLNVVGPGAGSLTVTAGTAARVFTAGGTQPISISGMSITGGHAGSLSTNQVRGGCVYSQANLTLTAVRVFNCTADAGSGTVDAYADGGAIGVDGGSLTLNSSVVDHNTATVTNTSSGHEAQARGGAIYGDPSIPLTIHNSTIFDNSATAHDQAGPDVFATGGIHSFGNLNMDHSTVADNSASASEDTGAASATAVGGIDASATSTTELSTIVGNTADTTGIATSGTQTGGVQNDGATFTIRSSTIARNGPSAGTQEGANLLGNNGAMLVSNTIVADPLGTPAGHNCIAAGGTIASTGFDADFSPAGTSCFGAVPSDKDNVDPQLAASLAANGGLTPTLALLPTSPMIDAGSNTGDTDLSHDQRGLTRPYDFSAIPNASGSNGTDIGAFELQPACAEQAASPLVTCPTPSGGGNPPPTTTPGPTGQRAAALAKCKKKHGKRRKKCVKHANRLPV
jgi:hypothetical protein